MNLTLKDLAVIYNALNTQKANILEMEQSDCNENVIKDINSILEKYGENEVE